MPAKPFVIETRSFPRKQDAVEYFRSMLHRYTPPDRVSDQTLKAISRVARAFGTGLAWHRPAGR